MASLPRSEVSPDQTRESLIAISQTLPDKVPSKPQLESRVDAPGEEEYRSMLISISYTPPPDTEITTPESPPIVDGQNI